MKYEEAIKWLEGKCSEWNYFAQAMPPGESHRACAEADAARTEQAYWIVRANKEGLIANDNLEQKETHK